MALLKDIETSYYAAMQDAKLNYIGDEDDILEQYSTSAFRRWARKLDIYALGSGAADFSLAEHEEIITEFGDYRCKLADALSGCFKYEKVSLPGLLEDIGSCWDGSKVGKVNEMDSLYVMQSDKFVVKRSERNGFYHVYLGKASPKHEITPRKLRDQFAEKYCKLVSRHDLPDCLRHGGFKSCCYQGSPTGSDHAKAEKSGYSGLRYNGPAVTSQFLTKDDSLLTWDMTPVIELPDAGDIKQAVRRLIQPIIAQNPGKMFPNSEVHLIPDANEELWRLTTAKMEADILRVLSTESPVKKALSVCKILSSLLKKWMKENVAQSFQEFTSRPLVVEELNEYLAMDESRKKIQTWKDLTKEMKYAHVFLPASHRSRYHEDEKSPISINTAAVKHILIKTALQQQYTGAFSPKEDQELMLRLVQDVFRTLGDDTMCCSEHALLQGIQIGHFSVLAGMASEKVTLGANMVNLCGALMSEVLMEVRDISMPPTISAFRA